MMDKGMFDNHLRQQCLSLFDLCDAQISGSLRGILAGIPVEALKKIRNVTLTGCGDSFYASIAVVQAFKKYNSAFAAKFLYKSCMDVARYMDLPTKSGASTMIAGISASGSAARLVECMRRANSYGYETALLTNEPESPAAKEAKYTICVNTPPYPDASPGLRSYFASLLTGCLLAAKLGQVKELCPQDAVDALIAAAKEYVQQYQLLFEQIDDDMFALADKWMDIGRYETIGDGVQAATAGFIAAKLTEVAGIPVPVANAEDWCHVNYFARNPADIVTIIVADVTADNRSRIGETVNQAAGLGRKVLFITNGTLQEFGIRYPVEHCWLPTPPEGFAFLHPLMDHLPGTLLASYVAALRGEQYFRGGRWTEPGVGTIKSSKVVLVP